jgi:serine protease Do
MNSLGKISVLSLGLLSTFTLAPLSAFAEEAAVPAPQPIMSFAPIVDKVAPSVVTVYMSKMVKGGNAAQFFGGNPFLRQFLGNGQSRQPREQKEQGLGSGIIVSTDGYILTNNHVVDGADEINVQLGDDKKNYKAKLIGTDPRTDLALVKIDAKGLTPIQFSDSDKVRVGDVVLAVGAPFGLDHTVTMGIVSALGRGGLGINQGGYEDFIQTDAAINPGNSGGPLVDANGRLIGINSAINTSSGGNEGVGFAIPSKLASLVMTQLKEHGKVTRGYIGIGLQPLTSDLASMLKLNSENGALVNEVQPGTPGEKAGLKSGDVITKLNGAEVKDSRQLQLAVGELPPGSKVTLGVIRDGQLKDFALQLGTMPNGDVADSDSSSSGAMDHSNALDGITVDEITPEARQQFKIPGDVKGALITDLDQDSAGADAGLQVGDVIVEIDRQPVADADSAIKLSNDVKKGDKALLRVITHGVSRYVAVSDKS